MYALQSANACDWRKFKHYKKYLFKHHLKDYLVTCTTTRDKKQSMLYKLPRQKNKEHFDNASEMKECHP